ncbi:ubiquitin-protein ligase (E3), partial [Elasticomyces elasticus]
MENGRSGASLEFDGLTEQTGLALEAPVPYASADECLSQMRLLVQFLEPWKSGDVVRLVYFANAFQRTLREIPLIATEGEWTTPLNRLAKVTLRVLRSALSTAVPAFAVGYLLQLLGFLTGLIPKMLALLAPEYYSVMALLTVNVESLCRGSNLSPDDLVHSVLALLRPITSETLTAYEWFARSFLVIPNLPLYLGTLDGLANNINYKLLTSALGPLDAQLKSRPSGEQDIDARLWLLAYFIYFNRYALGSQAGQRAPEPGFVKVVSDLLNSTAILVSQRLEMDESEETDDGLAKTTPLHPFVKDQILSLINQSNITGLLSQLQSTHLSQGELADVDSDASREAKILATYTLTLLRVFPRRGDDIRMWLYLGSATSDANETGQPGLRIPAVKYFWHASRSSRIFAGISKDSARVLSLLKPADDIKDPGSVAIPQKEMDEEWTIILLFLELYTFVLKVMDDDEFFSNESSFTASSNTRVSWTKESALPLKEIKDLTVFLKNLAFTLYWNSADLDDNEAGQENGGIRSYLGSLAPPSDYITSVKDLEMKNKEKGLPGVTGIPSRRKFLPDGHWLMTNRFDMEGFIPAVVAEEENRHQLQDDEEEEDQQDDFMNDSYEPSPGLI